MQSTELQADLLTATEVATAFRVHRSTVAQWVRKGLLAGIQVGPRGRLRFRREDVANLLTPGEYPPAESTSADGSAA